MSLLLARGPVAEVYAVAGSALKVFPGKFDRRTLAAIERERPKLAKVPVLPIDGVEVVGGRHALRMELCGDSLASLVRREGPRPSEEVAALYEVLSRALAAAHRVGVLHGGVSPTNVLFRANGEPVLADFGVAQRQAFRRDPLYGVEWVSPETLRTGVVDERTDMYGLGAVLHFALTGESPHPSRIGELTTERILRVLGDPVPAISRPDVPIGLATAIGRLLAPDPAKRAAPWREDVSQPRSPSGRRGWHWQVALAVMLAAVLVVVLWPRSTTEPSPSAGAAPSSSAATQSSADTPSAPATQSSTVTPPPTSTPPPTTSPPPVARPVLELAEPTDLGNEVSLTWTTTDDRLYFAVVFWAEGEPRRTVLAERDRTMKVTVEPGRRYCFLVRGTEADHIVESQARAVRGADCQR